MSLRLAQHLGYIEIVTDFFATVRGGGLVLSPTELELVKRWREAGIPAAVVCRGIKMGAESHARAHPNQHAPRRLSYYAGAVADAFDAARERAVGAAQEPPPPNRRSDP